MEDINTLLCTIKGVLDDSFLLSEATSKTSKAKIRKNMQAIKNLADLVRKRSFDKELIDFKVPNYLTSIINKSVQNAKKENNLVKFIKEPVYKIDHDTIFKDYLIENHEALNRTNTIISHKLKNLMDCYTIINFKRQDYIFSFQKRHFIKGKVYTDPKTYEGTFELIENVGEIGCTLRLIITKY